MKKLTTKVMMCGMLATIVSCANHDFETVSYQTAKEQQLAEDFNAAFGVTGSDYKNHQWGMDIVPLEDVTSAQASRRAAQPNSNQWGTTNNNSKYLDWPRPADITPEERAAVLEVFNQKGATEYEPILDIENFFVQQVYCGPNGSKMNELAATVDYKINVISYWPYKEERVSCDKFDDIVNNFNGGKYGENGTSNAEQGCMLMWNSSTRDFSFKTSQGGGQRWYKHWRMEKINGNYYVGFDHESARQASANANEEDTRDYVYNDWIIKIVPGKDFVEPVVERVRVMCEDLGAAKSDFDYNDVVFDVKFIKNGSKFTADILLQAAGGVLPLYIGNKEVHELFKVPVSTMVNTTAGHHNDVEPVHFTVELPGNNYTTAWDAINALPVKVITDGGEVLLTTNPGRPAEMIAVPVTTDWSDEQVSIKNTYPKFANWIKDASVKWWE